MKEGLIFESSSPPQVTTEVAVGRQLSRLRRVVRFLDRFGLGVVVGGVLFVLWLVWPVLREEMKYGFGQTSAGRAVERISNSQPSQIVHVYTKEDRGKPTWSVPDSDYSIYIPKILAKSRVVDEVDPFDTRAYSTALKQGVAAAKGLAVPGQMGTTYLFAHSVGSSLDFARYNAIFYLLHRLELGDEIQIVYKDKLYRYQMSERHIIAAKDLSYLRTQDQKEQLVLQTCYPPGTSWKRLIVVATPIKTEN